ncbi:MAG: hypothetical protein AAF462_09505 [Thermodesulfobacteriota bacterium]
MARRDRIKNTLRIILLILFIIPVFATNYAHTKQLFVVIITVDGDDTATEGTNSLLDVTDFFNNTSLEDIFPDYTDTSSVIGQLDFRGIGTILEFESNSSELVFRIPGRDFEVRFDGESRDESVKQFKQWLRGTFESIEAPGRSLTRLLQIVVANSPVDPVAGNPNSLFTRMIIDDFNQGITGPFISSRNPIPGQKNNFSISAAVTSFNADPYDGETFSIPISYKWNLKSVPKLSLIVDFPVLLTRTQTAWSYMASLGLGAQYRPTKWWSLTPMARVGGVGSFDVGALAFPLSGTLTNYFHYQFPTTHVGWASQGGAITTIDGIEIAGWDLSYELTNYVWRNGGDLLQKMDFNIFGNRAAFKLFLNHTKFWGSELYLESFFDMGIGLATIKKLDYTFVEKMNLTFTLSSGVDNDYQNYGIKATYRF